MKTKKPTGEKRKIDGQEQLEEVFAPECSDSLTVFQHNELVRSPMDRLSIVQCKLVRFIISQVLHDDAKFDMFAIKIGDLAEQLGIRTNNIYAVIDGETTSLMRKVIYIRQGGDPKKPNYKKFHWVSDCWYSDGTVYIKLHESLKPYLIGLDKFFNSYKLQYIESFDKDITVRVFEWLNSYATISKPARDYYGVQLEDGEVIFDIKDVKEILLPRDDKGKIKVKYKDNSMFVKRVIEINLNKIAKSTPLQVDYRLKRKKQEDGFHSYIIFRYLDF